jgi:hypothetical protein
MGAMLESLVALPGWYWVMAIPLLGVLVALAVADEIMVSETDRFLWTLLDSWAIRVAVKLVMAMSLALFWPPFMVIAAIVTAVFVCIQAYYWLGMRIDALKFTRKYYCTRGRPVRGSLRP